jgi:hypothetical protein
VERSGCSARRREGLQMSFWLGKHRVRRGGLQGTERHKSQRSPASATRSSRLGDAKRSLVLAHGHNREAELCGGEVEKTEK